MRDYDVVIVGGGVVHEVLAAAGAPVQDERPGSASALEAVPRLFGHRDPAALFAADPAYGDVVCPCEQVTAAEVAAALRMRIPPARSTVCASARTRRRAAARERCAPAGSPASSRRMASAVAIVGAGEAGLACARELAGRARTVVIDLKPLEEADHEATAIRWDGRCFS